MEGLCETKILGEKWRILVRQRDLERHEESGRD